MYLFLTWQDAVDHPGSVAACIVVARDPESACFMHPDPSIQWINELGCWGTLICDHLVPSDDQRWPSPDQVNAQFIGEAASHLQPGPILSQVRM